MPPWLDLTADWPKPGVLRLADEAFAAEDVRPVLLLAILGEIGAGPGRGGGAGVERLRDGGTRG